MTQVPSPSITRAIFTVAPPKELAVKGIIDAKMGESLAAHQGAWVT